MGTDIAIDLANGITETIDPETWSGVTGSDMVEAMLATVEPGKLPTVGAISARALAEASRPYHLSPSVRERLQKAAPDFLAKIDEWAKEDR